MKKKGIAVYVRVSSSGQDTRSQEPDLKAWVKAHARGRQATWFSDTFTGKTLKRPGMKKLQAAIDTGQIETLVVWRLDRLGRTTGETLRFLEELEDVGVGFVSIRDHVDAGTASGRLFRSILASFATYEREVISERVRAGISKARAEGKTWDGRKKGTVTALTPKRLKSIEALLKTGASKSEIARQLHIARSTLYQAVDILAGANKKKARRRTERRAD